MAFIGNFILRFLVISFGFMFAIAAAGAFIGIGFYNEVVTSGPVMDQWEEQAYALISLGIGFSTIAIIAAYAFAVGGIIIAIAELMRWQGMVTNLVMGGACAAFLALTNSGTQISTSALLVALSAGFVGGFVYWLIAGRSAGNWLGTTDVPPSKS